MEGLSEAVFIDLTEEGDERFRVCLFGLLCRSDLWYGMRPANRGGHRKAQPNMGNCLFIRLWKWLHQEKFYELSKKFRKIRALSAFCRL